MTSKNVEPMGKQMTASRWIARALAILKKVLPILPFAIAFLILYYLYPSSFESTWKGRTFYLFFMWLIVLETILNWEEFQTEQWKMKSIKTVFLIITCSLPIIYVIASNFFGLNGIIIGASTKIRIGGGDSFFINLMPLSIEYLVFTVLFALILLAGYEMSYLKKYALSILFLGLIGFIYMSDNLYPNGKWAPLQLPVFPTTTLSANVLNLMGFNTTILTLKPDSTHGLMPYLSIRYLDAQDPVNPIKSVGFTIGWPCAGVESLLIYAVTILLFLSKSTIPFIHKIVYFAVGAVVTYFINILRIVTIFMIAINYGQNSPEFWNFHNYYGSLYSITWIIFYPLILIGINSLWTRIKEKLLLLLSLSNFDFFS